jgi:hypothetical protein
VDGDAATVPIMQEAQPLDEGGGTPPQPDDGAATDER